MRRLLAAWRKHPVLTGAFVIAALLTAMFAVRMVMFTVYWSDPAHRDQSLQGWMTPGYIAQSWDVPREDVLAAIATPDTSGKRKSLDEISVESGISLTDLTTRIEAAIAASRAAQ